MLLTIKELGNCSVNFHLVFGQSPNNLFKILLLLTNRFSKIDFLGIPGIETFIPGISRSRECNEIGKLDALKQTGSSSLSI